MNKKLASTMLAVLLLFSCATAGTWQDQSKATIVALTDSWDLGMSLLGSAYTAGNVTEAQKNKAIAISESVRLSLRAAATAADSNDTQGYANAIAAIVPLMAQLKVILTQSKTGVKYEPASIAGISIAHYSLSGNQSRHYRTSH